MRKLFFICLIMAVSVFSQEKGYIKLDFDEQKLDIPLNYIEMRKDDEIRILARGEVNNGSERKLISFEILLKKLDRNPRGFRLQVSSDNKKEDTGSEFIMSYLGDDMSVSISRYKKGERITRNPTNIYAYINVTELKYENNGFVIRGKLNAVLKSTFTDNPNSSSEPKVIAEIKNGFYEIIF